MPVALNVFGDGVDVKLADVCPLAVDWVRFVGEPVAAAVVAAVAADPYTVKQAALLVDVDYEELEPVVDARRALEPDAALAESE